MVCCEDSVSIIGMKHSDFKLLEEIINHQLHSGKHFGRKDYYNHRIIRLKKWIVKVNRSLEGCKIDTLKDEELPPPDLNCARTINIGWGGVAGWT